MKRYRISFLVNPISGGGRGRELFELLPEVMGSFGYDSPEWRAEFTLPEESAQREQIGAMIRETDRLIAVGGDGTVNAVLTELVRNSDSGTTVGLIPLGTGNDLARALGIYRNFAGKGLTNTLRKLVMAQSELFDLWSISGKRTMAAYCSAGIDAAIAEGWDRDRSEGKIPFRSDLVKKGWYLPVFWRHRSHRLPEGSRISWTTPQGERKSSDLSRRRAVVIGNIRSYAGGAQPFALSDYADGLLEILVLPSILKFGTASVASRHPWVARWLYRSVLCPESAREIDLILPPGEPVQIDGEIRTEELSSAPIAIRFAGQVRLLSLRG